MLTFSDDHCSGNTRVPVHSVLPALTHHAPLCLPVGKPIKVQKTPQPSQEEVDRIHQCYIKELANVLRPQTKGQRPQRPILGDLLKGTQRRGSSKCRAGIRGGWRDMLLSQKASWRCLLNTLPEPSLIPAALPHARPQGTAGSWERRPDSGISDFLSSCASSVMGPLHVCPPEKWERCWERMMSVSVFFVILSLNEQDKEKLQ